MSFYKNKNVVVFYYMTFLKKLWGLFESKKNWWGALLIKKKPRNRQQGPCFKYFLKRDGGPIYGLYPCLFFPPSFYKGPLLGEKQACFSPIPSLLSFKKKLVFTPFSFASLL
jgi:hypothetical protein